MTLTELELYLEAEGWAKDQETTNKDTGDTFITYIHLRQSLIRVAIIRPDGECILLESVKAQTIYNLGSHSINYNQ
jgi:hypothetical protein